MFALSKYQSFLPRFYRLASVSVLANMMVPLAGLCDTAFLGHLQELKHLAGVILASILFDYLYRIFKFLRNSTNAMTAQAGGRNDNQGVLLAGLRSGLIALLIALVILGLQYPIQKLGFAFLSGTQNIELEGIQYFNSRIWGAPAVLLNFVLIGWFLGRAKNGVGMVLLISIVANGSNVLLDYLMISSWGWGSMGAGLATAISQYLALFVGLVGVAMTINYQDLPKVIPQIINGRELQGTLKLNADILVRFLALISAYSIFTNFSAGMSTESLAKNGLLLQIALLSQFTIQGIGMTTQTLIGHFRGKGDNGKFMPLVITAIVHSLPIALTFVFVSLLFPETIFGLLTSHSEINQGVTDYTIWLLPLLSITTIAFMFEAYFIGLKQGAILRNASLIAFFGVFLPIAVAAKYLVSVNILWLSLTLYMFALVLYLGYQMIKMQRILGSKESQVYLAPQNQLQIEK